MTMVNENKFLAGGIRENDGVLSEDEKSIIDSHFLSGTGIDEDMLNAGWMVPATFCGSPEMLLNYFDKFQPTKKYSEYLEKWLPYEKTKHEYIMRKTNVSAVVAYDALVEEYNNDLDRMKKEKDVVALKDFLNRAWKTIRNEDRKF